MENLFDVVFGVEHIIAEFFWNAVFALTVFLVSKSQILRRIHKYIDDRHDVKHDKY
jgi:hypothetical protein